MAVQNIYCTYLCIYIGMPPHIFTMPVINIYLDEELFEFVKKNKSKIIKQALKEYKEKLQHQKKQYAPHAPA